MEVAGLRQPTHVDHQRGLVVIMLRHDIEPIFAEAYLATQRKHDAEKVWPLSATPLEVLETLSLSELDYGIDGVFPHTPRASTVMHLRID